MRVVEEVEPNDIDSQVHDLGPLSPQDPIILSGQLDSAGDTQDWFYIRPTVSGTITGVYVDDSGREEVVSKHFNASEQVPHGLKLEDGDRGVFKYYNKLILTPDSQPLPSPTEEQLGPQPDPTLLPQFEVPPPQAVLGGVPQYLWTDGCSPTAVASIFGYWDQRGYDNLFWNAHGYDEVRKKENVRGEISSQGHNDKYGDGFKFAAFDKFWLPDPKDSIADYLGTSRDGPFNWNFNYGTTYAEDIAAGIHNYAAYKGYDFKAEKIDFSDFSWDDLKAEIKNGRPILASIDAGIGDINAESSEFTGKPNHNVPIIGYTESAEGNFYYFYLNWSEDEGPLLVGDREHGFMRAEWHDSEPGVKWGVEEVWTVLPQSDPVNIPDLPPPPPPPPPPEDILIA